MRVPSHSPAATAFTRDLPKPGQTRGAKGGAETETVATPSAAPETTGPKSAPPGLTRVLAKLEALGEAGRSPGQNNAMDRVSRNLARYQENQAIAPLPPAPAPEVVVESPVVEAPAPEPVPEAEVTVDAVTPEATPPTET